MNKDIAWNHRPANDPSEYAETGKEHGGLALPA